MVKYGEDQSLSSNTIFCQDILATSDSPFNHCNSESDRLQIQILLQQYLNTIILAVKNLKKFHLWVVPSFDVDIIKKHLTSNARLFWFVSSRAYRSGSEYEAGIIPDYTN